MRTTSTLGQRAARALFALTAALMVAAPLAAADQERLQSMMDMIDGHFAEVEMPAGYSLQGSRIETPASRIGLGDLVLRFAGPNSESGEVRIRQFASAADADEFAKSQPALLIELGADLLFLPNEPSSALLKIVTKVVGHEPASFQCITAFNPADRTLQDICKLLPSQQDDMVIVAKATKSNASSDQMKTAAAEGLYKRAVILALSSEKLLKLTNTSAKMGSSNSGAGIQSSAPATGRKFGLQFTSLYEYDRQVLGVSRGIHVTSVDRGGFAERIGLGNGDVVVAINGRPVGIREDVESIRNALSPGSTVTFTVVRDGDDAGWASAPVRKTLSGKF
jgi:hypothetical protein